MTALFILRGVFHAATWIRALEFALSISHRHASGYYFHGHLDLLLRNFDRFGNFNGFRNSDGLGGSNRLRTGSKDLHICMLRGGGAARNLHKEIPIPGSFVAATPLLLCVVENRGPWMVNARLLQSGVEKLLAASSLALVHSQIDQIDIDSPRRSTLARLLWNRR